MEWDEIETKTKFIYDCVPDDFDIIETMLCVNGRILYESGHKKRMFRSAKFFNFPLDILELSGCFDNIKLKFKKGRYLCRITVNKKGVLTKKTERLIDINDAKRKRVKISKEVIEKENIFLRHKLSYRPWYERSVGFIKNGIFWDEIFFNQNGELCEGSRSNVFLEIKGQLYTPPVECGLLSGLLREKLLADKKCREKILYREDLESADRIFCGNSVRGLNEVDLIV